MQILTIFITVIEINAKHKLFTIAGYFTVVYVEIKIIYTVLMRALWHFRHLERHVRRRRKMYIEQREIVSKRKGKTRVGKEKWKGIKKKKKWKKI